MWPSLKISLAAFALVQLACAGDPAGDHAGDDVGHHGEDHVGDHGGDHVGYHGGDHVGDHGGDHGKDHGEDHGKDNGEDYGKDHGEDHGKEPAAPPKIIIPIPPCTRLCDLPPEVVECEETLLEKQRAATAVWTKAYAAKDVDTMISYVVPDYIQHNPNIQSGKEIARFYIKKRLSDPTIVNNITKVITQLNFVVLHVHRTQLGKPDMAMADIYRLDGTCVAEHWDVQQEMDPHAPNPLAFF